MGVHFGAWLVASFVLLTAAAQTAGTGGVEGRVLNTSSGNYLAHARISVDGTTLEVATNDKGEYTLPPLPAGEHRITARFVGLESRTASVSVAPGQLVRLDFDLALRPAGPKDDDVVKLDQFTVVERELTAQAMALQAQRTASNIKNVVEFEEFADMGEGNPGEMLKYLPGMSFTFGPSSPGAASIRGMPPNGTVVTFDGMDVAAPGDRAFGFSDLATGNIARIEVTKSPTPDLPANAIGGTVNIIGKSGFGSTKPRFTYNVFGTLTSLEAFEKTRFTFDKQPGPEARADARPIQPGVDLSYIFPVNKSLAFTFNVSRSTRFFEMDYFSPTWNRATLVQTAMAFRPVTQSFERTRYSATADWRINRANALRLTLQRSNEDAVTTQSITTVNFGAGATGGPTFTQGAATGVGTAAQSFDGSNIYRDTDNAFLRYTHEGDTWKITAGLSYSQAARTRKDVDDGFFRSITTSSISGLIVRADGLDGVWSETPPKFTATNRAGTPVEIFDPSNATLNAGTTNQFLEMGRRDGATLELSRVLPVRIPASIKFGGSIGRQLRDTRTTTSSWTFSPPGGAEARVARNYDVFANEFTARKSWTDTSGGDLRVRWLDPSKFHQLMQQHPEYFVFDATADYRNAVLNSKALEEVITAGFFRTDLKFIQNRLSLVAGVRFERTDDEGWGPLNDIRATFVQDANGNLARDSAGNFIRVPGDTATRDRLQYQDRGSHATKSYSGYYPSVNANFAIRENLVARAAYARTIGRPSLNEIIPGVTITDPSSSSTNRTITIVNTGLKPWTSDNYDLSLELYHTKGADASVGVFRKDITNFFGQTRVPATPELLADFGLAEEQLDYDVVTKSNFGAASITGVEWSYRQSLLFLPSWARGFQVFINLTKLSLSGANADDFSSFSPRNVNWGVTFARPKFVAKFNVAQHRGVRLASVNAGNAEVADSYQWEAPKTTIDVSAEYRFNKKLALYIGARNLSRTPKRTSTFGPGVPDYATLRVVQHYGSLYTFGLKGEF